MFKSVFERSESGRPPGTSSAKLWFNWMLLVIQFWNDQRWNCKLFLFGRIRAHGGNPFTEPVLSWYWWMHEFRKSMSAKSSMSKYGRLFQMYQRRSKRFKIQPWKLLSHRSVIWKLPLESGQRLNHEYDQYIISLNTVYILILMNIFPILIRHSMHTRVRNLWQCEYSLKTKNYWRTRYFNR